MSNTKRLHELIELANAGKKFRARAPGMAWLSEKYFTEGSFYVHVIAMLWEYEEIKEPRVVEFEAIPSKETNQYAKIWAKELKPLIGVKCRVVVTEVIDE